MKNHLFLAFLIFYIILTTACAKEIIIKGDGKPDIDKYLECEVQNLTEHDDKYYYPKFLIKPTKKQGWNVLEYEIHYQYVFGQDWNILYDVRKRYSENDIELQELNKNGYFSIYYELEKVPVETVYDPSSYYGVLNYNSIDVLNCYIRVSKQK